MIKVGTMKQFVTRMRTMTTRARGRGRILLFVSTVLLFLLPLVIEQVSLAQGQARAPLNPRDL